MENFVIKGGFIMSKEMNESKEMQERLPLEESALENVSGGGGLITLKTCPRCGKKFPKAVLRCTYCYPTRGNFSMNDKIQD